MLEVVHCWIRKGRNFQGVSMIFALAQQLQHSRLGLFFHSRWDSARAALLRGAQLAYLQLGTHSRSSNDTFCIATRFFELWQTDTAAQ